MVGLLIVNTRAGTICSSCKWAWCSSDSTSCGRRAWSCLARLITGFPQRHQRLNHLGAVAAAMLASEAGQPLIELLVNVRRSDLH